MADLQEQIDDIHLALRQKICSELDDQSDEYNDLVSYMEKLVGRGFLSRKKTLQGKLDALQSKGHLKPGDYTTLKDILQKSKNVELLEVVKKAENEIQLLREGSDQSNRGVKRPLEDNNQHEPSETKRPVPDETQPSTSADCADPAEEDEFYKISDSQKGYLLILNSRENRAATNNDVEALKSFFEGELKFEVDDPRSLEEQDFDKEGLLRQLEDIQTKLNLESSKKKFYCFICVILSHGDQRGIRTRVDDFITVEEIRKMFNNNHVRSFAGRPKVFLVQACQGRSVQGRVYYNDEDDDASVVDEDDAVVSLPTDADTLIGFSTTPGYRSFRRVSGNVVGSWFIQECLKVFQENRNAHVIDNLIKVQSNVARNWSTMSGGRQMPCFWTTLTKKLILK